MDLTLNNLFKPGNIFCNCPIRKGMVWITPQQVKFAPGSPSVRIVPSPSLPVDRTIEPPLTGVDPTNASLDIFLKSVGLTLPPPSCRILLGNVFDRDSSLNKFHYPRNFDQFEWFLENLSPPHSLPFSWENCRDFRLLTFRERKDDVPKPAGLFCEVSGEKPYTQPINLGPIFGANGNQAFLVYPYFPEIKFQPGQYIETLELRMCHSMCHMRDDSIESDLLDPRLKLPLMPGVYPFDSIYLHALMKHALQRIGERPSIRKDLRILVMGTGAGVEAVVLAKIFGLPIDAVDIQRIAVGNTLASALVSGTHPLVRSWVSDGFSRIDDRYDVVLFSAPCPRWTDQSYRINTVDLEGRTMQRVLRDLVDHLKPDGEMILMGPSDLDPYGNERIANESLGGVDSDGHFSIHRVWPR